MTARPLRTKIGRSSRIGWAETASRELLAPDGAETELGVDWLAGADHGPRVVDAEQVHQVAKVGHARRCVDVPHDGGVDASICQDPLGGAALGASGIEVQRGLGHGLDANGDHVSLGATTDSLACLTLAQCLC